MLGVGNRNGVLKGLWLTIVLGLIFSSIQAYEYIHAPFPFKGLNYGASFFMATGFHGFHVIIGTIFLIVCLIRAYKGDFTPRVELGSGLHGRTELYRQPGAGSDEPCRDTGRSAGAAVR